MLPDFTGVLATYSFDLRAYVYRPYINGRRLNDWDGLTREVAEQQLSKELDDLAAGMEDADEDA